MSRRALWKCSVRTTPQTEAIVEELLHQLFNQPVASYTDAITQRTTVSVYLEAKPSRARIKAVFAANPGETGAGDSKSGYAKISLTKIRREDWANSWKRHFKPFEIG